MTPEDKKEIEELFNNTLNNRSRIDQETHRTHHNFVQLLLEKKQKRDAMLETIKQQTLLWGVIVVLTGAGKILWDYIKIKLGH